MEYRADFILNMISVVFPIIIQVSLWTAIFNNTAHGVIYGYTYTQMLMYAFMAGLVSKLVSTGFEYEVNEDIKNGGLNKYIVKPVGYFPYRLCCFAGSKIFASVIILAFIIGIVIMSSLVWGYALQVLRLAVFLVALLLALLLNFLIYFCISMAGFWFSEVARLFGTINIILIIISGGIFPLDIFGSKVMEVVNLLPFKYTMQFPVDILNGKLLQSNIIEGFIVQSLWICLMVLLSIKLWKTGLKKYIAVGG